eukprot:2217138-Amphidinium_carterae.1
MLVTLDQRTTSLRLCEDSHIHAVPALVPRIDRRLWWPGKEFDVQFDVRRRLPTGGPPLAIIMDCNITR